VKILSAACRFKIFSKTINVSFSKRIFLFLWFISFSFFAIKRERNERKKKIKTLNKGFKLSNLTGKMPNSADYYYLQGWILWHDR